MRLYQVKDSRIFANFLHYASMKHIDTAILSISLLQHEAYRYHNAYHHPAKPNHARPITLFRPPQPTHEICKAYKHQHVRYDRYESYCLS